MLDALAATMYGLTEDQMKSLIKQCDYPSGALANKSFTSGLLKKGFWRVDRELDPELRHTVLTYVAFCSLAAILRTEDSVEAAVETFFGDGLVTGWQLPEKIRLNDFGLGHDERSKREQPVAAAVGPQTAEWQTSKTNVESWQLCQRHAENMKREIEPAAPISSPTLFPMDDGVEIEES